MTLSRDEAFEHWCHVVWQRQPRAKPHRMTPQENRAPGDNRQLLLLMRVVDSKIADGDVLGWEFDVPVEHESLGRRLLHEYPTVDSLLASGAGGVIAVLLYAGLSAAEIQAWDLHSAGNSYRFIAEAMHRDVLTARALVGRAQWRLEQLLELEEAAGIRREAVGE